MSKNAEMTAEQLTLLEKMLAERLEAAAAKRDPMLIRERRTGIMISPAGEDGPTPERMKHGMFTGQPLKVGREVVTALRDEDSTATPLPKYHRENQIDDWQLKAGLKLHGDFARAALMSRVTGSYAERSDAKAGWDDIGPAQQDARRSYVAAMDFVYPRFRPVLIHVCCLGFSAADWAISVGMTVRGGKSQGLLTLRYGLDDLVDHYGLKKSR